MNAFKRSAAQLFAQPAVSLDRRTDGTMIMRSLLQAGPPVASVGHWLEHWAQRRPDSVFLAERRDPTEPWSLLHYGRAWQQARAVGAWLLAHEASVDHPVAILSDNAIDHALLTLGAMLAGIPVGTISTAYSLMSVDHARLRSMVTLLSPRVIYVSDTNRYRGALKAIDGAHDALIVATTTDDPAVQRFADLLERSDVRAVDSAFSAVGADTIARFLFTSGSTGTPKAVINTHRMLCSSQESKAVVWPFLDEVPPVIVDWLPWSHTFGANHNFNMVLRNGGTLYIDAGRPAPALAAITAANIEAVGPNLCFNVPRGYDMLITELKRRPGLRTRFFESVDVIFYAAAALPQHLWDDLNRLSLETTGALTPLVSAWGSTETSPLATDCHFQADRSGNIGVPVPDVALKLVPNGHKLEIRVKGPNVTPGYWREPALTAAAFDDEGYYRIGDAVRFADETQPAQGLFFDGRIAEDFKLSTGTFVHVGQLRLAGIAALAPIAQDIVVTGHDRDEVGFLVFPNIAACRELCALSDEIPVREVLEHQLLRQYVAAALGRLRQAGGGSSRYATRARLMEAVANVDAGEITDKGYINQLAVTENRRGEIDRLIGDDPAEYIAAA